MFRKMINYMSKKTTELLFGKSMETKKNKTVVIKVGTSTLAYSDTKRLNLGRIEQIVKVVSDIQNSGVRVILVTSGAIGVGRGIMNQENTNSIEEKQAMASIGQVELMSVYRSFFSQFSIHISQVLLTNWTFENLEASKNAQNTFCELLKMGVIPIVNENDVIATDEIKLGDNDTLSARVACLVKAYKLIILSDIDGLFDKDPNTNKDAKLISEVDAIDENIEKIAEGSQNPLGTGGMITKINAAKIVNSDKIEMHLINGNDANNINKVLNNQEVGTRFKV